MLAKPEPARYIVLGLDSDRVDDRAPERPPRRAPGGDRLDGSPGSSTLELKGVSLSFGGLRVVDELDLRVDEGEIVSVIGPNGAGKTTLFNLITGIYRPESGDILLDGKTIVGLEPHQISRRGISRTFQTLRLFLNMSVKENVMTAAYGHTRAGVLPFDAAHARHATGGAGDRAARPRPARLLRRAPDGLPLGPARILALVRESPPPRDRPRDRHQPAHPAARRACRRA